MSITEVAIFLSLEPGLTTDLMLGNTNDHGRWAVAAAASKAAHKQTKIAERAGKKTVGNWNKQDYTAAIQSHKLNAKLHDRAANAWDNVVTSMTKKNPKRNQAVANMGDHIVARDASNNKVTDHKDDRDNHLKEAWDRVRSGKTF